MSGREMILLGIQDFLFTAACCAGLAVLGLAGRLAWRACKPRSGAHAAGGPLVVPADRSYYGSMNLDAERAHLARFVPGEQSHVRDRETAPLRSPTGGQTAIAELAPEAIADGAPADFYVPDEPLQDALAAYDAGEPVLILNVPEPVSAGVATREPSGLGHPADLLSQLSDEDFWLACRFELRRLAWMAWEPLALPAWTGRAAA